MEGEALAFQPPHYSRRFRLEAKGRVTDLSVRSTELLRGKDRTFIGKPFNLGAFRGIVPLVSYEPEKGIDNFWGRAAAGRKGRCVGQISRFFRSLLIGTTLLSES